MADQLRRQLAFISAITGNLGEGVFALDPACRITFANPVAERLLGWPEMALLDRDMHTVLSSPDARDGNHPAGRSSFLEVARSGVARRDDDAVFTRRDGTALPVAYSAAPIVAAGRVMGVVVAFRDIAERKRGEARQQRLNEELEARVQAELARAARPRPR